MATKTLAVAALAATLFTSTILPAAAEQAAVWHTYQKWTVRVDRNLGYGCFMHANYEGGTEFRVGINVKTGENYIEIMNLNHAWDSLAVGADITIMLAFDNSAYQPWVGKVTTLTDGLPVIYFRNTNWKTLDAIALASVVRIQHQGRTVLNGSLAGSAEAVRGMAQCQMAFLDPPAPSDPFRATAPARRSDPFKAL